MANLNRDQFFNTISTIIGDRTDAEAIQALEDLTDTYNAMEKGTNGDGIDWKKKFEDNDASWRAKYRQRFLNGDGGNGPSAAKSEKDSDFYDPNAIGFKDLFTKG